MNGDVVAVVNPRALAVNVAHDAAEGIWYVLSSDIPGLNAEASSLDALVEIISDIAPDLIAANLSSEFGEAANIPLSVQHTVNISSKHAA